MSKIFYQTVLDVVESGLDELAQSIASKKTSATPVSETYFLSRWVTKVIKEQRFNACVVPVLTEWQRNSRSMGKNAQLKTMFETIKKGYRRVLEGQDAFPAITAEHYNAFLDAMEAKEWELTLEYPVLRKVSHFTDGQQSLVVCCEQAAKAFNDDGELVKPLSLYVRGQVPELLHQARLQGILLHKVTDYKSKVKYHGEYVIYPANEGTFIPEFDVTP
uniref:DUF2913 family protein n=1 Tax=Thaumasiovibrio occultus TaxID=1891184 RepID=UPI000B3576AF|nr:DUF2913 family protein [Thaumasiovibrio occultus]